MAISGGTLSTASALARSLGIGMKEAILAHNVASTSPTCSGSKTAPNQATIVWTNVPGEKYVTLTNTGTGASTIYGPYAPSASQAVIGSVANATYTATVKGSGVKKKSTSFVMS